MVRKTRARTHTRVKISGYRKTKAGVEIKPTLYHGSLTGESNYMAGTINGELVLDKNGLPMHYKAIPNGTL